MVFAAGVSCSDKSVNAPGSFDVYGRVVYRPLLSKLPSAEFYLFHNGQGITDARITVGLDTLALADSTDGFYKGIFPVRIGDSLSFAVVSQFGAQSGFVTIPDTASIIRPAPFDTLISGAELSVAWRRSSRVDGYYAYLESQNGLVAVITESPLDTTADMSGQNMLNIGADRFWVETLRGSFIPTVAPDGRLMPRGVVGAAGTYCDVYVVSPN